LRKNNKKENHVILSKEPDLVQLTLMQLLKITLFERMILKKQKQYKMEQGKIVEINPPTYHDIAIVLDENVYDVMRVNPQFADVLLSNPTFVEVTEDNHVHPGRTKYVGGQFITEEPSSSAEAS